MIIGFFVAGSGARGEQSSRDALSCYMATIRTREKDAPAFAMEIASREGGNEHKRFANCEKAHRRNGNTRLLNFHVYVLAHSRKEQGLFSIQFCICV